MVTISTGPHEMITASTSPEKASLKRCSLFKMESSDISATESDVLNEIICPRQDKSKQHRFKFRGELAEAAAMKQHVVPGTRNISNGSTWSRKTDMVTMR